MSYDIIFRKSERTHRFDIPVRNAATVKVPDAFDHAYELDSRKMQSEFMLGAGEHLSSPDVTDPPRGVSPDIRRCFHEASKV